ncbi:MAG: hypothetical protein KDD69_05115 [Bdellovibrionales bacterium]|nr:hypothetical protein [Bdellovibrionales bacterium]
MKSRGSSVLGWMRRRAAWPRVSSVVHSLLRDGRQLFILADANLDQLDPRTPLCLAQANRAFLPLLENWLTRMCQLGVENLLVTALDREVFLFAKRQGVSTIYCPSCGTRRIHRMKTRVVEHFLARGFDVVLSDVDAVWLKNCLDYLQAPELERYDALFSIEYGYPKPLEQAWGFVLCPGFYFIRSRAATRELLGAWVDAQRRRPNSHDQHALNYLLYEAGISWRVVQSRPLSDTGIAASAVQIYSEAMIEGAFSMGGHHYSVGALPLLQFRRGVFHAETEPYMAHIGSGPDVAAKIARLKEHEPPAWFLPTTDCYRASVRPPAGR